MITRFLQKLKELFKPQPVVITPVKKAARKKTTTKKASKK